MFEDSDKDREDCSDIRRVIEKNFLRKEEIQLVSQRH